MEEKTCFIRNERESDCREVEEFIRRAFWNLYGPGCDEHYIAHILRSHEDFVPELNLVIEENGSLIGNIMYTRSILTNEEGQIKRVLTFGPLSVAPEYQRKGYGKKLMEDSFRRAIELGYDTIVIFGNPENYCSSGFVSCRRNHIQTKDGIFPTAMLVKELVPGAIPKGKWIYTGSSAFMVDEKALKEYDRLFEPMEKGYQTSQELFYIYSHSQVVDVESEQ